MAAKTTRRSAKAGSQGKPRKGLALLIRRTCSFLNKNFKVKRTTPTVDAMKFGINVGSQRGKVVNVGLLNRKGMDTQQNEGKPDHLVRLRTRNRASAKIGHW